MNNKKLKASEIIDIDCCGQGLVLGCDKEELVKKVEILECLNILLENQLNNALKVIQKRK